uniref:Ig-like domain-containing protein n=1 Tax=Oryctolagus cuniculus TaxID=9986 RepID=G1TVI5_RABIT
MFGSLFIVSIAAGQGGYLSKEQGFSRSSYPESRFWSWSFTLTSGVYLRLPGLCLSPSSPAMLSASCSVTVVVLLITVRRTNGDSVTQTEGPVILSEGSPLTLNCSYQTSSSVFLFWYVQYLHEGPQLLLKSAIENQRVEHEGFHATLVKKDSSFHLHKSSLQLSDSAVYYCALRDTVRGTTGEVEHKPRGVQLGVGGGQPWEERVRFPSKVMSCLPTLTWKEQIPALMSQAQELWSKSD